MKTEVLSEIISHFKEIEIDIQKAADEIEYSDARLSELPEYYLTFCEWANPDSYEFFLESLITSAEAEIEGNIKNSKSRVNALFYVKKIFFEISGLSSIFIKKETDITSDEQALKDYLKEGTVQDRLKTFLFNKKAVYSARLLRLKSKISAEELFGFEDRYVKIQYEFYTRITVLLQNYDSLISTLTGEDFKAVENFFNYNFSTLTLSDKVKLTDKEVNEKIQKLDIRQTALFFD